MHVLVSCPKDTLPNTNVKYLANCEMKFFCAGVLVLVPQSCLTLCDPIKFSSLEYWSGLPCPPSKRSSQLRGWTRVSCIAGGLFTIWATREGYHLAKSQMRVNVTIRQNIDLLIFLYGFGVIFKLCIINKCS